LKTVLITGASSGIGASTARLAAQSGWRVLIGFGRGRARAEALSGQIRAAGGQAQPAPLPLGKPEEIAPFLQGATAGIDRLDALVLNASPAPGLDAFLNVPP